MFPKAQVYAVLVKLMMAKYIFYNSVGSAIENSFL